uniref:TBP-like 1 n=1 Tax=Hucho hucho TaxID=62062 RepID=A0A4W5L4E5_9TELE
MKLRKPRVTASIWSSGKIICTGATSEDEAKQGARRLARTLQKLGFKVRDDTADLLFSFFIKFVKIYEPELHPAATYRIKTLKATHLIRWMHCIILNFYLPGNSLGLCPDWLDLTRKSERQLPSSYCPMTCCLGDSYAL